MKNYEVIKEGLAKARFGMASGGAMLPGMAKPLSLAVGDNNGGLNPEEFLVRPWRILSAAVTPYRFFDFTEAGVLQAATPLFEGLTLYANHNADVNSWKGFVQTPTWDEQNDPPGINALFVLDKTVDPNLARGVEIKALRSASVTIWFEYKRSHPDLRNFYDQLGEEVDGQVVRFVVTKITNAGEVSIVWEGEDPFAKSLAAGGAPDKTKTGLEAPNGGGEVKIKLSKEMASRLGMAGDQEVDQAELEAKIEAALKALDAQVATLKPEAELGKQLLTETRQRAGTLYKAFKGEKFQEAFVTGVIDKADLATARALVEEYQTEIEKAIPLACPKCGEKLARRSSLENDGGDKGAAGNKRPDDYKV